MAVAPRMLFSTSKSTGMWAVQCLLFRVDRLFTLKTRITFFQTIKPMETPPGLKQNL